MEINNLSSRKVTERTYNEHKKKLLNYIKNM